MSVEMSPLRPDQGRITFRHLPRAAWRRASSGASTALSTVFDSASKSFVSQGAELQASASSHDKAKQNNVIG